MEKRQLRSDRVATREGCRYRLSSSDTACSTVFLGRGEAAQPRQTEIREGLSSAGGMNLGCKFLRLREGTYATRLQLGRWGKKKCKILIEACVEPRSRVL